MDVSIDDVVAYFDARLETLVGDKAWVGSRAEELQRAKAHFLGLVEHTVSFAEANELAGVTIQVYADAKHETAVGEPLITDGDGEATADLTNGVYYFAAEMSGYQDCAGIFTVDNDDVDVGFEMEAEPEP